MAKHQHELTPSPEGTSDEAAAYWDARLRSPDCSAQDRADYQSWRNADPANATAFERLQDMLETLRASGSRPMLRQIRDAALRQRRRRRLLGLGFAAAAALTLAVISPSLLTQWNARDYASGPAPLATSGVEIHVYETAVGERTTIELEDGSEVTLNTRSRLEERFSANRRDVTLVAGQALFRVAHDATRPFVVTAGDRQVTAIGTEFDVRLDGDTVRVVLVEGRVAVARRPQGELFDAFIAGRRELTPGEEYVSSDAILTPASIRAADVNRATLWQEGRVAFEDISLPEAVAEMNRYSPGALIVTDPSMAELRINGVFRTDEPQAFVNAIEEYFPVEARQQPGGDTLLVWRN